MTEHHSTKTKKLLSLRTKEVMARPGVRKKISCAVKKVMSNPKFKIQWLKTQRTAKVRIARSKAAKSSWAGPSRIKRLRTMRTFKWKSHHSRAIRKNWKRHERQVATNLKKQGWKIIQYGWPDFVCIHGQKIMFVEAKAPNHHLNSRQKVMHQILKRFGIKVQTIELRKNENQT